MSASDGKRRIGIVGGTFDPVHLGHLMIAEQFADYVGLDRVILVPASRSPFKVDVPNVSSPSHRLAMLQRAIGGNPRFSLDEWELRRGGTSYTIDTVEHFKRQFPDAELFLLIGADQARQFHEWRDRRRILTMTQLCIVRRHGTRLDVRVQQELTLGGRPPILVDCPLLELSSTEIRRRVAAGRSIRYLTPDAVADYIYEHSLYRDR